jgi:hypothetical protein
MANNAFAAIRLTGGTAGCLDDLIHTNISDGDLAFVLDKSTTIAHILVWHASSTGSENTTPRQVVVNPDSAPATGRWLGISINHDLLVGTGASDTKLLYQYVEKLATTATGVSISGLMASTTMNVGSTIAITGVLDEDAMGSDSAVSLATQQSIKAYVDNNAGIANVVEDTTPQLGGDLDMNGKGIDFPTTANITDCLDEDNMASDSATKLCTQQSIKKYVDDNAGGTDNALDVALADLASDGFTIEQTVDTNTYGAGGVLLKTDANWDDCDADAEATCSKMLGIAVDAGTGADKTILLQGLYRNDTAYAWTPGAILYASTTPGAMTETAPSATGDIVRVVGYAISADVIYFDPDKTYIEV